MKNTLNSMYFHGKYYTYQKYMAQNTLPTSLLRCKTPPTSVLDVILNNLMVRHQ